MRILAFFILGIFLVACSSEKKIEKISPGNWLFELTIDTENPALKIPFNVEVISENELLIKNADEEIFVNEIEYRNDSIFITIPVFGSEFKGKLVNNTIEGEYWNYNKNTPAAISFVARFGIENRFVTNKAATFDFSGNWQASFGEGENTSQAIGIFRQNGNILEGTFQTEVGDYRFLEGVADGNEFKLSCFDGAHAFLFTATEKDGKLEGMFYSGNTWKQKWTAQASENPELGDMKSMTFLKPGFEKLAFAFPNVSGDTISLEDERFKNKVCVVQIFGTWCPNCMDETRYLVELYNKYNSKGLEIIGLDFETKYDFDYFKTRIERFRNDLNVPYELLFAGPANKTEAAKSLPMLNKIISYPTAIFINKKGDVVEIHTGFSGPGTGSDYGYYKKETEELIVQLLNERP